MSSNFEGWSAEHLVLPGQLQTAAVQGGRSKFPIGVGVSFWIWYQGDRDCVSPAETLTFHSSRSNMCVCMVWSLDPLASKISTARGDQQNNAP